MNVIIPCGGTLHDEQFFQAGYRFPRPLINVAGVPVINWVINGLHLTPEDSLWIGIDKRVNTSFGFSAKLKKEYPNFKLNFVLLQVRTKFVFEAC